MCWSGPTTLRLRLWTTSPPSPALESTQTQVSTYHSHSGRNQSYSRFPVMTGFARRRVEAPPPVGPTDWDRFGQAEMVLFASPESTHCQFEPHRTNFVQSQGGQGTDSLGSPLLAQQNLVLRPGAPGISPSLVHSSEGGPPFSGEGHILAPAPQSLKPPPMVPGRDQEDFRDLFLQWAWTGTYLHLHSGFMSQPYQLTMTWWAADRWGNTIRYQVSERSSEPSSAASNPLLGSCCGSPRRLFLTALTSIKSGRPPGPLREQFVPGIRTSGFSRCLETPAWIRAQGPHHFLQRSGDDLASYSSQEDDPSLTYVMPSPCPAHLHGTNSALEIFGTALVCYGGQQKGKVVSKQRISHWLSDAIWMAYRARGLPCPLEETGTSPTISRHSAAPLRKPRLRDTAVTGQSWTLDGHDEGPLVSYTNSTQLGVYDR
ncbi:2-epi-valiolone synthase [Labeo rohita]|uniref:2-epi-valiolone synthase n=1 Tax=Labeo rohita TaxID=84645 RepID=A0ABQ8L8I1_LABRO|nr:2-epi-valiolone synthase [Labeo rohita]